VRRFTGVINPKKEGTIFTVCIGVMMISCGFVVALGAQQSTKHPGGALSSLRQLGVSAAKAVLDKDVSWLLRYDRPDLRAEDEISLKDKKSDLYCFLFDSACLSAGERRSVRSVYEKLSTAHELGIKVVDGGRSPRDGTRYAIVLFYDRSTISQQSLRSREFLCKESLNRIASWSFKLVDGKWQSTTPLFDSETDTLCSPD
jgi:hypothetical protein